MGFLKRLLFLLFFLPIIAVAQSAPYFEFAPKISSPFDVDDESEDVFEVLLLQNDHISGFDIWYDNVGSSSDVSFGLRRDGDPALLGATTIVVPTTSPTFEGTRFQVDLGSTISVNADDVYTIKVFSETPEFRMYKVNRRVIQLEHTAPYTSEYINGAMRIGDLEQDYGFKFALYENQESIAPILSNATTTIIDLNEVEVNFNANEPVDFKIAYTPQGGGFLDETNFTGEYTLCSQGASPCILRIPVVPNTTYNYTLTAKDEWGNEAELSGSFDSAESAGDEGPPDNGGGDPPPPEEDVTAPVISNLRITFLDEDEMQIAWTTNEIANSLLSVRDSEEAFVVMSEDLTFELEHVLATSDVLDPETTYTASVVSTDTSGNAATSSINFTTLEAPPDDPDDPPSDPDDGDSGNGDPGGSDGGSGPPPPPVIDFSNDEESEDGLLSGKGAVTFRWEVPEGGTPKDGYRLDIFDENGNLVRQLLVGPNDGTSATIRDLLPGQYTIILYSNRDGVFQKIAEPTKIRILPKTFLDRVIGFWYVYILVLAAIVSIPWYLIRKERARLADIAG